MCELPEEAVTIPGEHYPENVHVLKVMEGSKVISIEPCCGTHCTNTKDIVDFCIVAERSSGVGVRSLRAVAGDRAVMAKQETRRLQEEVERLQREKWMQGQDNDAVGEMQRLKHEVNKAELPLLEKYKLVQVLEDVNKKVRIEVLLVFYSCMQEPLHLFFFCNTGNEWYLVACIACMLSSQVTCSVVMCWK